MKLAKKSQIWISVIIYTLVALLALVLILNTGVPILTEMKDRSVVSKVKDTMIELDKQITTVANQGEGSQAVVSFEIRDGELKFADNQLIWEIETDSKIVAPRTSTRSGNLIIASNANVNAFELNDSYLLENTLKNNTFSVRINKRGSKTSPVAFTTSQLIDYVSFNGNKMEGQFRFELNGDNSSTAGIGYTEMIPVGNNTNLGKAKVIAHMNTNSSYYDLVFTLESYADFLTVNVKNFQPK
jgi:hypothetical protein